MGGKFSFRNNTSMSLIFNKYCKEQLNKTFETQMLVFYQGNACAGCTTL